MRTDLDGFTHFRELAGIPTLAWGQKLSRALGWPSRRLGVVALFLLFIATLPVTSIGEPSPLTSSLAQPVNIPHLFTPLPAALDNGFPDSDWVLSMESVKLNSEILGFSAFIVSLEGRDFEAERVDSERHIYSEMFRYRLEGEERLSIFTKSYHGVVFGHIQARGKSYFVSQDGDHYNVVSGNRSPAFEEVVHYPFLTQPLPPVSILGSGSGKSRAVRSGPLPTTVGVNIAICLDYRDAVGGVEKATARVAHVIDRLNNAYLTSKFNGKMEIREIFFIDPPQEVVEHGLWAWAIDPAGPVAEMRKLSKAAATFVFSKNVSASEAWRTYPGPIDPDREVAICGGFFAQWDDGDIHIGLHEGGHLSGGDHNPESSRHGPDDPQITARDWYSCEEGIYGLLSYNVCGKWLQRVEMYSGLNAVYAGKVRGNEMQNNVGTFVKVFEFMKGEHE